MESATCRCAVNALDINVGWLPPTMSSVSCVGLVMQVVVSCTTCAVDMRALC